MTDHVHEFHETPAMMEAGERPRCACGARREEPSLGPAILAIDPGTARSAWVALLATAGGARIALDEADDPLMGIDDNGAVLEMLRGWFEEALLHFTIPRLRAVVVEKVESFGMAVGSETFETVFWSGRFAEAVRPVPVHRIGRKAVKLHLCQTARAKDANVRQALIDRFGGKEAAVGRKSAPGPLYGVTGDVWAALAVGICWLDQQGGEIR